MTDLAILVPSRARPHNIARLANALGDTCTTDWEMWVGLELDDPSLDDYLKFDDANWPRPLPVQYHLEVRAGLSAKTNILANRVLDAYYPRHLAFLGDDHLPQTHGWDKALITAIKQMDGPGWAYGDDLLQGERIPTAWLQSSMLVAALGWMMLPTCQHLCVDCVVHDLGHAAGRIAYLPEVTVEHLHPAAGKAGEDDTYRLGNNPTRVADDGAAYRHWRDTRLHHDAAIVKELRWTN